MNWYKLAEAEEVTVTPEEFKAMSWSEKRYLAQYMDLSLSQRVQNLFFTQEYDYKDKSNILWHLAENTSISPQTQLLFFTQEYSGKIDVLSRLSLNPSFLKGVTLQEMREFTKAKEARLPVYKKRLKTIKEKIKL